jgi:hypothetical protein
MVVARSAAPARHRIVPWDPWVIGAAVAVTLVGTAAAWGRVTTWRATAWDYGFYMQCLWLLSHGSGLAVSTLNGHPAVADAGVWWLYPLAAVFWLTGPAGLLCLQAASLASGILFLDWWARRRALPRPLFWGIALLWAVYPAVLGPALFDWHPDTLVIPVLFWALSTVERDRPQAFWIPAILLLTSKVTGGMIVAALAAPWWLRRQWATGAAALMLGVGWSWLDIQVLEPMLLHHAYSQWGMVLGWLGPTPTAVIRRIVTAPGFVITHLEALPVTFGVGLLLGTVGFVPAVTGLWRGGWAWPAWIVLAFNSLSHFMPQHSPFNQYGVAVAPGLLIAAVDAATLVGRRLGVALPWILAASSVLVWWVVYRPVVWYAHPPAALLSVAARYIPARAPLLGQNATLAPLAARSDIRLVSLGFAHVSAGTYALLTTDVNPVNRVTAPSLVVKAIHRLEASPSWRAVYHRGSVWLFVKRSVKRHGGDAMSRALLGRPELPQFR